jgi:3-deoxy-D-manno-octulosonate 8-phosphate phosphatase (KDO 8-P phosphatase)
VPDFENEIDWATLIGLENKEAMTQKRITRHELARRLRDIKLVSLDVDGVMTDGGLYFADDGLTLRKFNVKDGQGIKLIMAAGIEVVVISSGPQEAIRRRMESLGIRRVFTGVPDKTVTLKAVCDELGIGFDAVLHMGDDLNDLPVMSKVGCPIAPPDAVTEIRDCAIYLTALKGGAGAVREVCDMIVRARSTDLGD